MTQPGDTAPQVELISRGWSVVDVDAQELASDPLDGNDISTASLAPGSIEIAVDNISVVTGGDEDAEAAGTQESQPATAASDPWEHLRPKGEMPRMARRVGVPARIVEITATLTAVMAVIAGAAFFFLNTRLQAVDEGRIALGSVSGLELATTIGLIIVAVAAATTALSWLVWRRTISGTGAIRDSRMGTVTLIGCLGTAIAAGSYFLLGDEAATVKIASNTIIILGLGLVATAAALTIRIVSGIEHRMHI